MHVHLNLRNIHENWQLGKWSQATEFGNTGPVLNGAGFSSLLSSLLVFFSSSCLKQTFPAVHNWTGFSVTSICWHQQCQTPFLRGWVTASCVGFLHSTEGRKVLVDEAISDCAPQSLCVAQGLGFKKEVGGMGRMAGPGEQTFFPPQRSEYLLWILIKYEIPIMNID